MPGVVDTQTVFVKWVVEIVNHWCRYLIAKLGVITNIHIMHQENVLSHALIRSACLSLRA